MLIIFFVLGLIVGSFLNVVVYRINLLESILGRSYCPSCKEKVRWYDNIPVLSFLVLGTKCRDCGEKISWQYPILEIATGIIFALVADHFFVLSSPISWIATLFYIGVFSMLLIIFVYDLKYMEIPMIVLWAAVGWTATYLLIADWANFGSVGNITDLKLYSGLIGGAVAFLFFYSLVFISKEKWMGMGDAYLGLLIGLVIGWPKVLLALMLAFTLGAFVGIVLILMKKKTMQSKVPFGPFLIVGLALSVFIGDVLFGIKFCFEFF